jgi:hypothetical protein
MNEIAAIACFFNFDDDEDSVQDFLEVKESIERQGVPLFVIEIISEGRRSLLRSKIKKENHFINKVFLPVMIRGNALNYLSSKIPSKYKYLASIGDNKIILNDNWVEEASVLLDKYKMVKVGDPHISGFPVIAGRDFFDKVGLFDYDFCNLENLITLFGATGKTDLQCVPEVDILNLYKENNLKIFYKILSYKLDCYDFCEGNVATVNSSFKETRGGDVSVEELIPLLKEIDIERNIHYKDPHTIVGIKNINEFNYPVSLLNFLKKV